MHEMVCACAVACVRACVCWSAVHASRHLVMGSMMCRPTWKLNRFGRGRIATCRARGQDIGFARARTKFHVALLFQRVRPSLDPASISMSSCLLIRTSLSPVPPLSTSQGWPMCTCGPISSRRLVMGTRACMRSCRRRVLANCDMWTRGHCVSRIAHQQLAHGTHRSLRTHAPRIGLFRNGCDCDGTRCGPRQQDLHWTFSSRPTSPAPPCPKRHVSGSLLPSFLELDSACMRACVHVRA